MTPEAWIQRNYGRRPSDHPTINLVVRVNKFRGLLQAAEKLLRDVEVWDDRLKAVRLAWKERKRDG